MDSIYSPFYNLNYPLLFPSIFFHINDRETYLSGLDSDTRDYVIKHTTQDASREDLERCVSQLKYGK